MVELRCLSSGDGDQELLGLDHLEVVVAHAVARAGLEAGVVTLGGVAQDGGVALVGGPADRSLSSFICSKFHDAEPSVP